MGMVAGNCHRSCDPCAAPIWERPMHRLLGVWAGSLFIAVLLQGGGGQDVDLKQALALEKTVQKVIEENDASVAGILVSRSDLYARFGQSPNVDHPGKLGAFDHDSIQKNALFAELSITDRQKLLKKLDLADPTTIPQSAGCG